MHSCASALPSASAVKPQPDVALVAPIPRTTTSRKALRSALKAGGLAVLLGAGVWALPADWSHQARLSLLMFGLAMIAWTLLDADDTAVAIAAALALVVTGGVSVERFHQSLGDSLIWLLLGAFVLAAVVIQCGLAQALTQRALRGPRSLGGVLIRTSVVVAATAWVVPSTSARAALLQPMHASLMRQLPSRRARLALTLLFPTVILLSAAGSLLGAGAHLVALEYMRILGMPTLGFAHWTWLMAPFAIVSCVAAVVLISFMFLSASELRRGVSSQTPESAQPALSGAQLYVLLVAVLAVLGWLSTPMHGLSMSVVALLAALAACFEPLSGISLKRALKQVEWSLLLFLAATLVLGESLVDSGVAQRVALALQHGLFALGVPNMVLLAALALVALLSHLLIVSRTARAVVLLPMLALPLAATGLNPVALILLIVAGSGFCQTFAISAKPVALFARSETTAERVVTRRRFDRALLKLALALLPIMLALLLAFAVWIWPALGLPLQHAAAA